MASIFAQQAPTAGNFKLKEKPRTASSQPVSGTDVLAGAQPQAPMQTRELPGAVTDVTDALGLSNVAEQEATRKAQEASLATMKSAADVYAAYRPAQQQGHAQALESALSAYAPANAAMAQLYGGTGQTTNFSARPSNYAPVTRPPGKEIMPLPNIPREDLFKQLKEAGAQPPGIPYTAQDPRTFPGGLPSIEEILGRPARPNMPVPQVPASTIQQAGNQPAGVPYTAQDPRSAPGGLPSIAEILGKPVQPVPKLPSNTTAALTQAAKPSTKVQRPGSLPSLKRT